MLADFTVPVRLVVVNFCLRSERIIKIGQYLPSLCSTEKGPVFWLTLYMYIGKWHIIWSVALNWTNSLNLNLICQLWSTFDNNETNRTYVKPLHNSIICAPMKICIDVWIRKSRWMMRMLVAVQGDTWWDGDWQQGDGRRTDGRHVVRVPCSSCQRNRSWRLLPDQGSL